MLTYRIVSPLTYEFHEWWPRVLPPITAKMGCPHILDAFKTRPNAGNQTYAIAITDGEDLAAIAFYIDEQDTLALTLHFAINSAFYRQARRNATYDHLPLLKGLFTSDTITGIPYVVAFIPRSSNTPQDVRKLGRLKALGFVLAPRTSQTHYCYYAQPRNIRRAIDRYNSLPYTKDECGWA